MRNVTLLYVYSFFVKRITMPIVVLYYLLNELSYTQIGVITAVTYGITLFTEVHGGKFTDRYGKRLSLQLAAGLSVISMALLLGNGFWWYLAAGAFYGFAGMFITGTRGALLYDTLKERGRQDEYARYRGRMITYAYIPNALVLLVVPLIYELHPKLPFGIMIVFFLAALACASMLREVTDNRNAEPNSVLPLLANKKVLAGLLFSAVAIGTSYTFTDYAQPLLLIAEVPVTFFGAVYAAMRGLTSIGAELAHRLPRWSTPGLGATGMIGAYLAFGLSSGFFIIAGLLLLKSAEGLLRVLTEEDLSIASPDNQRATTLSLASLFTKLFVVIPAPIIGWLADLYGVQHMFILITPVIVVAFAASMWYRHSILIADATT